MGLNARFALDSQTAERENTAQRAGAEPAAVEQRKAEGERAETERG